MGICHNVYNPNACECLADAPDCVCDRNYCVKVNDPNANNCNAFAETNCYCKPSTTNNIYDCFVAASEAEIPTEADGYFCNSEYNPNSCECNVGIDTHCMCK